MDEKKEARLAPECRAEKHAPFFTALKTAAFLAIGVILFGKTQNILAPEWNSWEDYTGCQISSIEALETKELDALFLGASHAYYGIAPMILYQDFGITSYTLATSSQTPVFSYYLLQYVYKTHQIGTVFLDVSGLFIENDHLDGGNTHWRKILDKIPFTATKCGMIKEYIQYEWSDSFISTFFPLIAYHNNWKALPENVPLPDDALYFTFGQAMYTSQSISAPFSQDDIEYIVETTSRYSGKTIETVNGITSAFNGEQIQDTPYIPEDNLNYFLKILELCREHGSNLVLIKVPTALTPQWYFGAWTRNRAAVVLELAETYKLQFWDMQYDTDGIVSFETDFIDAGKHLTPSGAEKVSVYLGERILEEGLATGTSDPVFDNELEKYKNVYRIAQLQATTDFREYLTFLKEHEEDWIIAVAASEDYATGLDEMDLALLDELGLVLARKGEFSDSYAAVISAGETVYEAVSDYEIYRGIQLPGATVELISKNEFLQWPGASIQINGQGYALSLRGLNVVVFDCETGLVIDSVVFDTSRSDKPCIRDKDLENQLLRNYISKYCYGRAVS